MPWMGWATGWAGLGAAAYVTLCVCLERRDRKKREEKEARLAQQRQENLRRARRTLHTALTVWRDSLRDEREAELEALRRMYEKDHRSKEKVNWPKEGF